MYTITVCTWTSHTVTVCSIYSNIIYCSSNVHNYCLHLDQSYSNSLFHIQIATPFSLSPVIICFFIDLYQSCPFRRSMPSASLWNKHKIPHQCPKFVLYHSLLLFALLNRSWSSPRISSVSFQFFFSVSSPPSLQYLCRNWVCDGRFIL